MSWVHTLQLVAARGHDSVTVTVASGKGSTPREAGAKMIVTADAVHGTIGGGELEYQALEIARGMLRPSPVGDGGSPARSSEHAREALASASHRFALGASLGQYCGGAANLFFERVAADAAWVRILARWHEAGERCVIVTPAAGDQRLLVRANDTWGTLGDPALDARAAAAARELLDAARAEPRLVPLDGDRAVLLEPLLPVDFNVVLFGAGHVGRALARVLGTLPCRVTWVDSREDEFPREVPDNVHVVATDFPLAEVAAAADGAYCLVMTHSHALDLALVEAILEDGRFAYCGMIGSQTKRRTFENALAKHGVSTAALARLTCPIGIPGIKGKEPGAIAVAVAAQLLEQREHRAAAAEDRTEQSRRA